MEEHASCVAFGLAPGHNNIILSKARRTQNGSLLASYRKLLEPTNPNPKSIQKTAGLSSNGYDLRAI